MRWQCRAGRWPAGSESSLPRDSDSAAAILPLAGCVKLRFPAASGIISTSATTRPPLSVPRQADMKLLPVSLLKLRLLGFAVAAMAAANTHIYIC